MTHGAFSFQHNQLDAASPSNTCGHEYIVPGSLSPTHQATSDTVLANVLDSIAASCGHSKEPMIILSTQEVLFRGLFLLGFDERRQKRVRRKKNIRRFRTHYGSHPTVCGLLLEMLQTTESSANVNGFISKLGKEKFTDYFFMALHLLTCYPTEDEAEAVWAKSIGVCDRTWRTWAWSIVDKIGLLKPDVIFWPESWGNPNNSQDDTETIFIITVDGVHCPIEEPTLKDFSENRKFYSHKSNGPALDYEIAISIFTQQCVWAKGPYAAGTNDITVFRDRLKQKMKETRERSGGKQRGIGDRGYRGERDLLSTPSSQDSEEVRDFKGRALSRHETFNGRIKNFDCMCERFRHSIQKHQQCFDAVVVICQLQLENGSPLFEA